MQDVYWITGIVLIGLIAALIYLYMSVRPVLPYLYTNTILQSRSGKYLTKSKVTNLIESKNLTEFVNGLTDTFFEVDAVDLENMHQAFTHKYVQLLRDIKSNTPTEFTELLNTYALLNEASVVRYLYRSKFLGNPVNDKYVYAVGSLTENQIVAMKNADDFAEFKALFSPTIYRKIMKIEHVTTEDFDVALDDFVSNQIQERLRTIKIADKRAIKDLFKMIVDQHNIMAVFQSIIRSKSVNLLQGGFVDTNALGKVETVDELMTVLDKTMYGLALAQAKADYDKSGRTAHFEIALERFVLEMAKKEVLSKPQGAFSIFVNILQAKQDKQNVQIISKGIEAGLKPAQIEEMIV